MSMLADNTTTRSNLICETRLDQLSGVADSAKFPVLIGHIARPLLLPTRLPRVPLRSTLGYKNPLLRSYDGYKTWQLRQPTKIRSYDSLQRSAATAAYKTPLLRQCTKLRCCVATSRDRNNVGSDSFASVFDGSFSY